MATRSTEFFLQLVKIFVIFLSSFIASSLTMSKKPKMKKSQTEKSKLLN